MKKRSSMKPQLTDALRRRPSALPCTVLIPLLLIGSFRPAAARELMRGTPEEVGMSGEQLKRVDDVIGEAIEQGQVPGVVLLVGRKGKVVVERVFGFKSLAPQEAPMTLDTIFDMASLTKVMATATSVMTLVEQGKLALTDSVVDYLPEFGNQGKGEITVQDLLVHYSGLRPDLDLDEPWEGYETAIALAFEEQLVAPPGERFIYSDINYLVLGELVRSLSGLSLDEYAKRAVFDPLGMRHTFFNPPEAVWSRIAPTEEREGVMLRGRVHDPTAARMGGVAGHAGLFSSAEDLAIFAQMILNGGTYGNSRVLSPLGVRQMVRNHSPAGDSNQRGYGFDIDSRNSSPRGDLFPRGSFGHTGFTGSSLWIDPSTETFVILLTSRLHPDGTGDAVPLRKRVASVVAASILDLEEHSEEKQD